MKTLSPALCLLAIFGYYFGSRSTLYPYPCPCPAATLYGHGLNLISKFAFVSGYAALRFCRYAQIPHKSFEPAHEQLLWTTTATATALLLLLLLLFKRGCFGCRFTHQQIVEFIGRRAGRGAAFSILSLHWRGVPVCANRRRRPPRTRPTQCQLQPQPPDQANPQLRLILIAFANCQQHH